MSIRKTDKPYSNDLTDDEIQFLKSSSLVPDEVKADLRRHHENIGKATSSFSKLSRMYRAEADMLLNLRDRDEALGEAVEVTKLRNELEAERRKNLAIEAKLVHKDREIERRTATPALVVHSGEK